MVDQHPPSLATLPIELAFRILDHLQPEVIFMSVAPVCARWKSFVSIYAPYQVKLGSFSFKKTSHRLSRAFELIFVVENPSLFHVQSSHISSHRYLVLYLGLHVRK